MYFFIYIIIQKRRNMQKPGSASPATTLDLDLSIVPRGSRITIIINYSALGGSTAY